MVREGSVVERRLALVVLSAKGYLTVEEDVDNHVLSVTARHVERSATMTVDCIRLEGENERERVAKGIMRTDHGQQKNCREQRYIFSR